MLSRGEKKVLYFKLALNSTFFQQATFEPMLTLMFCACEMKVRLQLLFQKLDKELFITITEGEYLWLFHWPFQKLISDCIWVIRDKLTLGDIYYELWIKRCKYFSSVTPVVETISHGKLIKMNSSLKTFPTLLNPIATLLTNIHITLRIKNIITWICDYNLLCKYYDL